MPDNWVERQLAKNPTLTIIVIAAVGVAFLTGAGVLRPVFRAGQWFGNRFFPGNSRPQPQGGNGVPRSSASQ